RGRLPSPTGGRAPAVIVRVVPCSLIVTGSRSTVPPGIVVVTPGRVTVCGGSATVVVAPEGTVTTVVVPGTVTVCAGAVSVTVSTVVVVAPGLVTVVAGSGRGTRTGPLARR